MLREAGALPCGEVQAFDLQPTGAFNSATMPLLITYIPDTPETAPRSLILKCINGTEWGNQANRDEGFWLFVKVTSHKQKNLFFTVPSRKISPGRAG
ncbi:hypothetical protein KSC_004210 [Ktedonobacter sp. SOSP1-52]|uniref:hypothetical protein n=1 Tax=Ktedonobacter sp. SOSP1-52 TaxID=2778366 RepID=UPI00191565AC|nr:hypothetical protein [Ktedonobacter sp. SOSP1-52]GHO61529.1 hypothetical protein KSC_004210 [Ktedonobacter sp. SOSP1-52]